MPAKPKMTKAQLTEKVMRLATRYSFDPDYGASEFEDAMMPLDEALTHYYPDKPVKVAGFTASISDLSKIESEIEGSCLTAECKKSLLAALKGAK